MLRSTTKTCVILLFLMAAMALHALALADGDAYSYLPENVHDDDPSKGFLLLDSLHLVKGSVLLAMQASQLVIHYLLEQRTAPVIISAHLRHGLGSIQPGATFGWTVHGGFESNTDGVLEVTVHIAPPQGCPAAVTTVVVHGRKDHEIIVREDTPEFDGFAVLYDTVAGDILLIENVGECEAEVRIIDTMCELDRAAMKEL